MVDGAALLDDVAEALNRYVVMSEHSRDKAALWVVHTYLLDCFSISPRLCVCSPVKRCGKTTLLDVLARLVFRPLPTANVTSSAVFRVVEAHRPSLLADEADTFLRDNDELRGVINSGHRVGGSVLRIVGEDLEPRRFSTYSACAIALIGQLPDTLQDRSVSVSLKRRLQREPVTPFRHDQAGHLGLLARRILRWAQDHAAAVSSADPDMPDGIFNREADNTRPLLAIAQVAGGHWPERARQAILASHTLSGDDEDRIAMLLGDVRDIFAAGAKDRDIVPSSKLADELAAIEGRPWAEYGRSGKPISQNQVARLLRSVNVAPEVIRVGEKTVRGYRLHRFDDAFARYLPSQGSCNRNTVTKADITGTSAASATVTPDSNVTVAEREKSNNDGLCYGVTVEGPGLDWCAIDQLAREIEDWAYRHRDSDSGDVDQAGLEAETRRRLMAAGVFPEALEVEIDRVMRWLFEAREAARMNPEHR
jgi:putative DNA primase/helicase